MAKYQFSEEEKRKIESAVKDFELASNGEVVPYYVTSSDDYDEASWYLSVLMGALMCVAIGFLSFYWLLPVSLTPLEVAIYVFGSLIFGFLIPVVFPVTKRLLISKAKQQQRVSQRAMQAFLAESVFNTQDRVGILIFISQLERKVMVLGDEGINKVVAKAEWEHIVASVVQGIKRKQITDGLVKAIGQCKDLMVKNGFLIKADDKNELPDGLRLGD